MNNRFTYTDEVDKCYGITGMIISLNVLENQDKIMRVSLDEDDAITFTPDFFFSGNPRFSAKTAWNEMLKEYQLMTGMVIGNILCRQCVHAHQVLTQDLVRAIRELVAEDGRNICSLDEDEIDMVYNKTFNYLSDIYTNPKLRPIADRFVTVIKQRRTMSGADINDELNV